MTTNVFGAYFWTDENVLELVLLVVQVCEYTKNQFVRYELYPNISIIFKMSCVSVISLKFHGALFKSVFLVSG